MRARIVVRTTLVTGLAVALAAGTAFSSGRGIRTRGDIRPYTEAHAGVVVKSGVHGEARTRTRDGRTEVRVSVSGLPHSATAEARLHEGRCADHGDTFKYAGTGDEVRIALKTGPNGTRAGNRVRVRPLPGTGPLSMVVHDASGARIACGDLDPD